MNTSPLKTVANSIKHWYVPLIIGILLVLIGVYVFSTPVVSYVALSVVFSISFFVTGIMQMFFSIANREELESWGWYLASGILYTLIGIYLMSRPDISITLLPFVVGFYVLFQSAGALGWAFDMRNLGIRNWGTIATVGVLGIIFSFILIWNPSFAGLSLVVWTGLSFVFTGISGILLAIGLKKIKDYPEKLPDDLKHRIEDIKKEYFANRNRHGHAGV